MNKSVNKESYFKRLQQLAEVDKTKTKAPQISEGTLIDYEFAENGVAYGIIKENHHYFLKKGNKKSNQDVYDFTYIGGLENKTMHQYNTLSEASKQRNFYLQSINEAASIKSNNDMTKLVLEAKKTNEDETDDTIKKSAEKISDLDTATEKEKAEDNTPMEPEPMDSEVPVDDVPPIDGEDGEEMPPVDDVPPIDDEEPSPEDGEEMGDLDDLDVDGEENEIDDSEIQKLVGKLTEKLRNTDLKTTQTKSVINSILASVKDKLPEVEVEDRKKMAEKLLKVVNKPEDELDDVGEIEEGFEQEAWQGTDNSLDISLFEYGFVAKQPKDKDYDDEWFVLYKVDDDKFDTGWIRESELDALINGEDWMSQEDVDSFLEINDTTKDEWLANSFINKFSSLFNHYGYENMMGSTYHGISKEDAEKMIGDESSETITEDEKEGLIEFEVPDWALAPLINGDFSALTDEEEEKINKFSEEVANMYGNANFIAGEYDGGADDFGFKPSNDIDNLGSNVFGVYIMPDKDMEQVDEEKCSECGSFVEYASANGYNKESLMEADDEECASLVSGYANAYTDGKNDGDGKTVNLFMNDKIKESLVKEYGHDEYVSNVLDKTKQDLDETARANAIDELDWGSALRTGLKFGKKAGSAVADKAKQAGNAVADKAKQVGNAVVDKTKQVGNAVADKAKQVGGDIKADYNRNVQNKVAGQIEKMAVELKAKIEDLNKRTVAGGGEPLNMNSVITTIANQLRGKSGQPNMGKYRTANEGELIENEEEPMSDVGFAPAGQTIGVASPSVNSTLDGGSKTTVEVDGNNKTVNISLNEEKLRKYVRNRLMELSGMKKPSINESKKSDKMKKLDEMIEKRFTDFTKKMKLDEEEQKVRKYVKNRLMELNGMKKPSINESKKSDKIKKLDKMIETEFKKSLKK